MSGLFWRFGSSRFGFAQQGLRSCLLAGTILLSGAAAAQAQTLEQALSAAYANNPALQAERAELRATDEGVPQALGRWRPTVELVGSLGLNQTRQNFGANDVDTTPRTLTFRVTQNLYEGGGTTARVAAAEAEVKAARARLLGTEQGILLDTVTAFMDVVQDTAVLDLNRQNERRLVRQLEATRDRFEVGEVTRTDVAQAESRVSRAQADTIAAAGDLEVSRAAYQEVVGELPGALTPPDAFPDIPTGRDEAIAIAQDRNPVVVAAVFDREAAERTVRLQAADLLPTVDLVGQAQHNRDSGVEDGRQSTLNVTATVTVPIYQQGIATSEIRTARQQAAQAERLIDDARRQATEDATAAWEIHQTALAQIRAFEDEVRATSIALEGVEQEAAVGSRTVLDVLDAEQELLDAQVNLVRAERDEVVALYDLLSAVGNLTAAGLALPVQVYDEQFYYNAVRDSVYDLDTWNEVFPGIVPKKSE